MLNIKFCKLKKTFKTKADLMLDTFLIMEIIFVYKINIFSSAQHKIISVKVTFMIIVIITS